VRDVIEIDGHKAVVTINPEIGLFRAEFVGLRGEGGADFYAQDREQLIEEGRKALEVYYAAMEVRAAERAMEHLASHEDELVPAEFMERLVNGENPVRVWREYRGLSVEELAERAGIPANRLTEIENGQRGANPYTTTSLAEALRLHPEDLA
jgi:ribosome-binding protein aMBF1 (putative translation factor)